jgi:flagella basal body P-ring formation protein FlgA
MKKGFCLWFAASVLFPLSAAFATDAIPPYDLSDTRNAYDISYTQAEETINAALASKGAGDKMASMINGRNMKPLFLYTKPLTVEVRGLQFDRKMRRFEGSLVFMSGDEAVSAMPVAGSFNEMVEIAVLKREVRSSDIIKESDIEIRDFAINATRSDTITDLSSLIGKAPVRSISAFRPIRLSEVANPAIVKKDAIVQMHYNLPGMEINTSAQVITTGAKGDVISVRNTTSKKIVQAVITDSGNVNAIMTGVNHASN